MKKATFIIGATLIIFGCGREKVDSSPEKKSKEVKNVKIEEIELPDCLKDAKKGEWVHYKTGCLESKETVFEVNSDSITILAQTKYPQTTQFTKGRTYKIPRNSKKQLSTGGAVIGRMASKPRITIGKVKIKGKEIKCYISELEMNGCKTRIFVSEEVPVNGLVKIEEFGKATTELIDYGFKSRNTIFWI